MQARIHNEFLMSVERPTAISTSWEQWAHGAWCWFCSAGNDLRIVGEMAESKTVEGIAHKRSLEYCAGPESKSVKSVNDIKTQKVSKRTSQRTSSPPSSKQEWCQVEQHK